jgi:hypothetical protein
MVILTTATLVLGQIVSSWVVYSELFRSWAAGFSGVNYLPWSTVLPMLYSLFILPLALVALTITAVRRASLRGAVAK